MNRALSPNTNVTGIYAAIAAIYAAVVMIIHFAHHDGIIDPQVIVSAVTAAAFLYTRFKVTPVADPKDGAGRPLVPAPFARAEPIPPPPPPGAHP